MTRALAYLRRNALAATALVCSLLSLAGASYAAFKLPAGSVGARQIKNHVIDPVKLDRGLFGGYVRAWAVVDGGGRVLLSSSTRPRVDVVQPGSYNIIWHVRPKTRCTSIVSVNEGDLPGYADAATAKPSVRGQETGVLTYNAQGQQSANLPFDVALIC